MRMVPAKRSSWKKAILTSDGIPSIYSRSVLSIMSCEHTPEMHRHITSLEQLA